MKGRAHNSINIKGYLIDLDSPKVMGILNVTPDSFFSGSRKEQESQVRERIERMVDEGVDIIDVGGCSTRPGFSAPDVEEEIRRLEKGCKAAREIASELPLSVDTFRVNVAEWAIKEFDADIINDVSGGEDPEMWPLMARERKVYVLTHNHKDGNTIYHDVTADVITELSKQINELHRLGVNDVIVDPGFGFVKTPDQNLRLLGELDEIARTGWPLLVGVSRKSMIFKTLGCTPEESLTGTIALNAVALEKGASILRVHDVKEAKETVKLIKKLRGE